MYRYRYSRPEYSLIFSLILLVIASLSISIYITQVHIKEYKGIEHKIEGFMMLPRGEYLKPMVMGYDQLVGDIIWLRAIQLIGSKTVTPLGYEWVYHALDVVTTLDPKFAYAYQLGGVALSVLGNRPDMSNLLLEKGMRENPDVWQIPFYMGYNNFFYLNDYKTAAENMARASELPGHPPYLPKFAARLYVQAGEPAVALDFLTTMYRETRDETVKFALEHRIKEVLVERDAIFLEGAARRYIEIYGMHPSRLIELVEKDIINEIPIEPFGGYYYINSSDGKVYSSVVQERMRVYGKETTKD